jgi:hypothetical protein
MFHSFMNFRRIIALAAKRAIRKLVTGLDHPFPSWERRRPAGSPLARIVPPDDETSALPEPAIRKLATGTIDKTAPAKNLAENSGF